MRRARSLLVVAVLLAGCMAGSDPDVHEVGEARLWLGTRDTPPPDDAAGWERRSLPDAWGLERRLRSTQGWYRTRVALGEVPDEPWAVYLPRAATTSAVWVNGRLVGDGGGFSEPLPRNDERPMLFVVPPALLRAGENVVDIRVAVAASHPGLLARFAVGPARVLAPRHARLLFLQVTLVQALTLATIGLGALVAGFFWRRDRQHVYRWLVAGVACWAGSSLHVFFPRSPLATRWWDLATIAGQSAFVVCSVVAFHRMLELRRRRLEGALATVFVGFALAHGLVPAPYAFRVNLVWGMATLALGVYLIRLVVQSARLSGMRRTLRLAPAGVIAIAFGAHDVASVFAGRTITGIVLAPYVPALVLLVGLWNILAYFADALGEAETLNRELERRVAEKAGQIERQHARLGELERGRAVAAERERIMRDVHDGMGGQLVSTLAMVESGRGTPEGIAAALRSALDDLRLVIDSLDPVEEDLLAVLATVRARLEPRLERHGIRFDWQVSDLPALPGFGPERVLQALRIVQEAITNVLKHARATTIAVRTGEAVGAGGAPGVFVEIADDGRGFDPAGASGRGLGNMAHRAAALGGRVSIAAREGGTVVRLWLPRAGAPAAA